MSVKTNMYYVLFTLENRQKICPRIKQIIFTFMTVEQYDKIGSKSTYAGYEEQLIT